ncbi:MAG TPA: translocation/assembly module TamB domain-containing protein [Pyrinomonadaceae bacterium]|jgi:translocation and assembly module TamB
MPVDDRDERPDAPLPPESKEPEVSAALSSETDAPLPPRAEAIAERDANRPEPSTPQGRRRRFLTRRNAVIATLAIAVIIVALIMLVLFAYKLGYVDRYVANQIKNTLAEYGIRAEIKHFETKFTPRTVEMSEIELYDMQTGAPLGNIKRMLATVRIEDLYALNLRRNVNLESLDIDGLEMWVKFDAQGRSNFSNLKLPEPNTNQRILFSYSTARVKVSNSVVHYGDERYDISGEARNLVATIEPENPNAPAEGRSNLVNLSLTNSTFAYEGRPVNDISVSVKARVNQTRADIDELVLRSPLAEAHLQGALDDWRALRYHMQITSMVDLTQASDVLQAGATLRGTGNFSGTVSGEGKRYQVDGEIKSDALAADNVRLQALTVSARGSGDGASYEANGKAVAQLLTAGDFQLNTLQLVGNVMGTGTDFRWLGELYAASARVPGGTTIAGLILSDAVAESRDGVITASAPNARATSVRLTNATATNAQASDVRVRSEKGTTTVTAGNVRAGNVAASNARINGLTASEVVAIDKDGTTNLTIGKLNIGGMLAMGAQVGSLNIAGVRLAIHAGRVTGSSGDINAGTVTLAQTKTNPGGKVENVKLARPVFTLEPAGRYRVTADLSLGGGVLGQVNLGAARAAVVATNNQIQLNNFDASIMDGSAKGNATLSTSARGASRVAAEFNNLDVGKLLALVSGRVVPLAGATKGTVDLTFPGTDLKLASGNVRAEFTAEAGTEASGRTPLNGEVALNATRGVFNIERASLKTAASELSATGRFSFESDDSDLQLNLNSTDASELQRVVIASNLLPNLETQLDDLGIELAGALAFNGNLRGKLDDPSIEGRASVGSFIMKERELGSLTAQLNVTPELISVTDGRLTEKDGGGIQFALNAPRTGTDNISLEATLDHANAGNLFAALPYIGKDTRTRLNTLESNDLSGRVSVNGLPGAMSGNADLNFGKGSFSGEPFESIVARATFSGSTVNVESVKANFNAGLITANGTFDTVTKAFNLEARGENIQLERLRALAGNRRNLPRVTGTANLNAKASGNFSEKDFSNFQITFDGVGRDVMVDGKPVGELSLVGRTENKQLNVQFTTGLLGTPQVVTANVNLADAKLPATIETNLVGADLTPLFPFLLSSDTVKVTGRATGSLRFKGNLIDEDQSFSYKGLQGTAEFTELNIFVEDIQLSAVSPLLVQFKSNEIFFERTQFTGTGTNIVIGGTVAIDKGGTQNLTVDGNLNLKALNGLSPNVFLTGAADVAVRVGGSFEQPRFNGSATVAGASVSTLISDQRLSFQNVKGRVIFNANQAQIDSLTGTMGGGRVSATGGALLSGFTPTRFRLSVHGDNVMVPYPAGFRTTTDADLEVSGTFSATGGQPATIISGVVNLRRAEYTQDIELADLINQRREGTLTEGSGESTFATTTQLDLRVEGRDALVVRNNLADTTGSVSLRIVGPIEGPVISGRLTATSGTLNFRRDRYEITRALIDLPAQRDADPILNIQAESEIKGYTVVANMTGPLSQPNVTLRSDPALPQQDVVNLVLTGDLSTGDTSASTLAQTGLGTAASLLTDTLINAPARKATDKLFGLNRFEIDPLITGRGGASPTARLTIGRQINKNLSITYSTNVTADQNQVLALEYRVSNRLSFVAQYEQGSVNGFSTRSNNFSFEIRFKKRF